MTNSERNVWSVPRNDIAAACAFYQEHRPLTRDESRTLLMLQDDNAELLRVIKHEGWEVQPDRED